VLYKLGEGGQGLGVAIVRRKFKERERYTINNIFLIGVLIQKLDLVNQCIH